MRGILGRRGGGEDDDRHVPSGRGRSPSLRDDRRNRLRKPPLLRPCDSSEVVDRDRSPWYGCDDSGWLLLKRDAIVWVHEVGSGWGIGRDCRGGGSLCSLQHSSMKTDGEDESCGENSGAGYSKSNGNETSVVVLHTYFCKTGESFWIREG